MERVGREAEPAFVRGIALKFAQVAPIGTIMAFHRAADPLASGACILVVDDEDAIRDLVSGILERDGHRVVTACSPAQAIEVVEVEDVAVVLTDVNMPGSISGLELIDELHALRPSLPIIPVTGSGTEASLQEALDRGAAGFIAKPFKAAELREKVASALTRLSLVEDELRDRVVVPTVASVLANAIEVRDASMEGHTERLAALAVEIGHRVGLGEHEIEDLTMGAVLHDVGKIGIPDRILMKPGPLTPEERVVIESHPEIGDRMLASLVLLDAVRPVVRHHHERWDGLGYPDRLAGDEIPLLARIVALADSIEAMSGERPYRRPLDEPAIVSELEHGCGAQWDPHLVEVAKLLIESGQVAFGPDGMTVKGAA
jgi:putative two-component system response regulator